MLHWSTAIIELNNEAPTRNFLSRKEMRIDVEFQQPLAALPKAVCALPVDPYADMQAAHGGLMSDAGYPGIDVTKILAASFTYY